MGWSVIREATEEDFERVAAARERFISRHREELVWLSWGLDIEDGVDFDCAIEWQKDDDMGRRERRTYIRGLWVACMRRALRCNADGIAYGHVGYSVD